MGVVGVILSDWGFFSCFNLVLTCIHGSFWLGAGAAAGATEEAAVWVGSEARGLTCTGDFCEDRLFFQSQLLGREKCKPANLSLMQSL